MENLKKEKSKTEKAKQNLPFTPHAPFFTALLCSLLLSLTGLHFSPSSLSIFHTLFANYHPPF